MKTNMKRKVKNLLLAMCIIGLGSATSAAMLSVNAAEQSATEPVPVLTMQEGASIKNFAPSGIRFVSKLSVDNYTELTGKGATFYTLFVPASRVPEGGITKDNYLSETIDAKIVQAEKSIEVGATEVTFSGVLVGLNSNGVVTDFPESAYNVGLTAVSYYTYTENEVETIEFASNPQTFSIAYIASALQAKGYEDAYYKDITNSVLTEGISFAETSYTVCVGGTAETVLNSKGLKAVYTSNNKDIVTVDETGKLTGKALGDATITATIGDITTTVNVTVDLGDTNFNAPKNPEDANCTCVNVAALDNADYAYFFTANDDETISYDGGIKVTDATAEGETQASATLNLPTPLDVENKNFIMSFAFKEVSGAKYTIWLYNEENKGAYGYCYSEDGYTEGGGLSAKTVDGVTTVKISSTKIAENNYYCDWTNQTAKQITKIKIMNGTSEFVLTGIELSEQQLTIISGGSAESLGYNGTVLADFEKNSDTCQNVYSADGNLVVKGAQYTYELPTAVAVKAGTTALKIRFKGGDPYFKFYDSDGNLLLTTTQTAGKENDYSAGFIDWPNHAWGGGVNITKVTDGDYIIITVSGEKVVGNDVKKIVFQVNAAEPTPLYVDYVATSDPLDITSGGSAESLGYSNGIVLADFGKASAQVGNAYIADGNLVVKGALYTTYTYELPTAVEVTAGTTALKIRFKGSDSSPYFKFYDSDGNLLLTTKKTEKKENDFSAGFIDWPNHTWAGGVNIDTTTDAEGYTIITVSGEKVVGNDVKKIVFQVNAAEPTPLYVDYIVAVNE